MSADSLTDSHCSLSTTCEASLSWLHIDGSHLCVLNGRFCQKQMPQYRAVCKKPSAALSDTWSSACRFPDWSRAFRRVAVLSQKCSSCSGKPAEGQTLLRCNRCRQGFYCDRNCQKEHWRQGHKSDCCPQPEWRDNANSNEAFDKAFEQLLHAPLVQNDSTPAQSGSG